MSSLRCTSRYVSGSNLTFILFSASQRHRAWDICSQTRRLPQPDFPFLSLYPCEIEGTAWSIEHRSFRLKSSMYEYASRTRQKRGICISFARHTRGQGTEKTGTTLTRSQCSVEPVSLIRDCIRFSAFTLTFGSHGVTHPRLEPRAPGPIG